jgi:hypothetical protein
MRICSTLEEFNNALINYKTSDADISIKEKAINELYRLNKDLLDAPRVDTSCSIMLDEID